MTVGTMRDLGLPLRGWLFFLMWFDTNALAVGGTGEQMDRRRGVGARRGVAVDAARRSARPQRHKNERDETASDGKKRGNESWKTPVRGWLQRTAQSAPQLRRRHTSGRRAQRRTITLALASCDTPGEARIANARQRHTGWRLRATPTRTNRRTGRAPRAPAETRGKTRPRNTAKSGANGAPWKTPDRGALIGRAI